LGVLVDYYKFYDGKTAAEAKSLGAVGLEHIIFGNDLDGNPFTNSNISYLDDVIASVTSGYYTPPQAKRHRCKRGVKPKTSGPKRSKKIITVELTSDDKKDIERIKENLVEAYPAMAERKDLQDHIENYCTLTVKIKHMLAATQMDSTTLKNLNDVLVKLGSYLGIDESLKAKQKNLKDKASIADLSMDFQQTLEELPEIMTRFRYKELRILLEKYDRQELSRELFELHAFANMTPNEARNWIAEREAKYEIN